MASSKRETDLCYHLRAKLEQRQHQAHEGGPSAPWLNISCPDCPAFANVPYTEPPIPMPQPFRKRTA